MSFIEVFIIGVGLSMDAFAVATCRGLEMKKFNIKRALVIALFFGGFQALMPVIGYFLGVQFKDYITAIDHYIVFGLLLVLGGKMIIDSFEKEESNMGEKFGFTELLFMAFATSIDALAVGISFAFLSVKIFLAVAIIGITTFSLTIGGVYLGYAVGNKLKNKAELLGGIILILLGTKILLEHLGVIAF